MSGKNLAGFGLSRACFRSLNSEHTFISLRSFNAGSNNYTARLVETLFSNWFYLGGDYGAFTLLRNTTTSPVTFSVVCRNAAGVAVAQFDGVLPANGGIFKNARDYGAAVAAVSGTVGVSHTGAPDAIVASTTVLSPTTGLRFDAPFMKRTPWHVEFGVISAAGLGHPVSAQVRSAFASIHSLIIGCARLIAALGSPRPCLTETPNRLQCAVRVDSLGALH